MRRLLVSIFVVLFFVSVSGSVVAVEKKTKAKVKTQKVIKKKAKTSGKQVTRKASKLKKATKKKYDTFVDKNNNGIDDRKENIKRITPKKAAKTKKKTENNKK